MKKGRRIFAITALLMSMLGCQVFAASPLSELRIGYSDFDPLSLVIRKFGWLDQELAREGIRVRWLYCPSGLFVLQGIDAQQIDAGSCVGLTSMFHRSHGGHNRTICITSRVQWLSLLAERDSGINSSRDLKGRKIAINPSSECYFFLLGVLHENGMCVKDVKIVPATHMLGTSALISKRVDAWIGLNPWAAQARLEYGAREIYRNKPFSTFLLLNVSEEFSQENPDIVRKIMQAYEQARAWSFAHHDEMVSLYSTEAKISYQVSELSLSQNDFSGSGFTRTDIDKLKASAKMISDDCVIEKHQIDFDKFIDQLIDNQYLKNR